MSQDQNTQLDATTIAAIEDIFAGNPEEILDQLEERQLAITTTVNQMFANPSRFGFSLRDDLALRQAAAHGEVTDYDVYYPVLRATAAHLGEDLDFVIQTMESARTRALESSVGRS